MFEDFKKFIMRGNVVDLAVGVIIGASFSKIIDSLVTDIIMPVIGAIIGGLDFSNYYVPLSSAVQGHPAYVEAKKTGAVLGYGQFFTYLVNFVIVAAILFLVIRAMQRLYNQKPKEEAPPPPAREVVLLEEIRDLLARR